MPGGSRVRREREGIVTVMMTSGSAPATGPAERIAAGIRRRVLAHVLANDGGYMSQACSSAEILATIYSGVVDLPDVGTPYEPRAFGAVPGRSVTPVSGAVPHGAAKPDRDRLIISPAHYALVVYAALIECGRLDEGALEQFNRDGSTVEMIGAEHSPGFETTTGSLAQALSHGGGIALARRLKGDIGRVWVFMSDGEFQEGQTWEALAAISFHDLASVRIVVDVNGTQCDGPMDNVMSIEPLTGRIESFGWSVDRVDGHDLAALRAAMTRSSDSPHAVLADTDPVRGLSLLNERRPALHYLRFTSAAERERYAVAYARLAAEHPGEHGEEQR